MKEPVGIWKVWTFGGARGDRRSKNETKGGRRSQNETRGDRRS